MRFNSKRLFLHKNNAIHFFLCKLDLPMHWNRIEFTKDYGGTELFTTVPILEVWYTSALVPLTGEQDKEKMNFYDLIR